jgi:hypothetical protein
MTERDRRCATARVRTQDETIVVELRRAGMVYWTSLKPSEARALAHALMEAADGMAVGEVR